MIILIRYLANKLPHFSSKPFNFGQFAKVAQPHNWDKRQLHEPNRVTPQCQVFRKFFNHRKNTSLLKCPCLKSWLANLI